MDQNPFLGVLLHWIGGLAAASFYLPYLKVRKWAWETYWLVGGFFSWIIAPWILSMLLVPDTLNILRRSPGSSIGWALFYGVVWGIGGFTFGLAVRYLGVALGVAVALGFCAAFGTLVPPIFNGEFGQILHSTAGQINLGGIFICLIGIVFSGLAGMSKEKELTEEQKKQSVGEFQFGKGIAVAVLAGFASAGMSFGLTAGKPIAVLAKASLISQGRADIWQGLPVLVVILFGGFVTNFIWCVYQNLKNKTGADYLRRIKVEDTSVAAAEVFTGHGTSVAVTPSATTTAVPLVSNYLFCAAAGVTWYMQFFFYSMGQTKMGKLDYSSWTLHMASIIIFSTLWGIALKEWKGTSRRTHSLIAGGLFLLIGSTVIVGYSAYLKAKGY